ncbi:hypothetical protein [Bradyrhizobium stylosanthis]|nr:hypothetical protein [Bradyrhizobium stylosanthis]
MGTGGFAVRAAGLSGSIRRLREAFLLWMAFVNGGGLILGGLWMRRI